MALPGRLPELRAAPRRRELAARHARRARPPRPRPDEEGIAELLDEAEEIVNAAGPQILAEVEAEDAKRDGTKGKRRSWFRFGRGS